MGCGGCNGFGNAPSSVPQPFKLHFTHVQFQAAALTNNIEAFSLPARGVFHGAILKTTIQFAGVGITDYKISIGLAGDLTRWMLPFDVDTAVANTNVANGGPNLELINIAAATSIRIAATSVGANLNQSTAGELDLWLYISVLP